MWVLVFWCCESSSLQQQKRPASSLLSSNIHPPSPPLLRLRRGRSDWEGRRTKPRWKKWPFNTRENNPEETWILCISLSSTISSSSPPWAPSPLLLTGDSVSKLTGDYFLRDEQSSVRALWSYPQSHFGERPGGQTVSVVVCVNIVSADCHEPAGWFTAASPERRKNKHGDPAIHFQRNNPLSVCQSSQEHHRQSASATQHDRVKRTQLN